MMQAAVLLKPGKLEIRETPVPLCPKDGVIVKVKACGICGSDAKMIQSGHRALVYPRILGHEIAGVVAESRVKNFREGDRVQVAPGLRCGKCFQCRKGMDNQCENRGILGFTFDGGFAQYVAVPLEGPIVGALNILPENVGYADATLVEPIACSINAQEKAASAEGDTVLIIGAGPLGLIHCFVARLRGAEKVIIGEIRKDRRKTAGNSWADMVLDPEKGDLLEMIMNETNGRGIDVIIFACSQVGINDGFLKLLTPGGRLSLFSGIASRSCDCRLDSNLVHYNEIVITGAYGCTASQNARAVQLISAGKFPLGELITHRCSLMNIEEGIEHTSSRKGLKSILEVEK